MRSEHLFRIVLMALMLCAAFLLQSTAHAQVVVTELMWMGSDLSSADEWLELTSVTDQHTDIAGWSLVTVKDGQEETMLTFPAGSAVAPGACFIVSNYAADQSRLALDPDSVTSAVSLPNTQLKILLKDGSGSILDSVDDGAGTPFAGANPSGTGAKASMERIDPLAAGDDPANWRTSVQSCGFDDGAALFGSPGVLLCAPDDDSPPDIPDTGSGDTVPDPPPEEPDPDSGSGTTSEPL
ncbi:MAG: lamin tail domain-containing protein, partial [Candidatus Peribacteraceae bacterium]